MKLATWMIIAGLLAASVFDFNSKSFVVTNNTVAFAVMLMLLGLFADLKEFDFWGLRGKKYDKDLKKLEGEKAVSSTVKTPSKAAVEKAVLAERTNPMLRLPVLSDEKSTFLALAFEIERLLRVFASTNLAKDIPSNAPSSKLRSELFLKGFLTESGLSQLDAINWIRNILVHGRDSEITISTLREGIDLATSLYNELNTLLFSQPTSPSKQASKKSK